jgi:hypothetical protein
MEALPRERKIPRTTQDPQPCLLNAIVTPHRQRKIITRIQDWEKKGRSK